ncbi:LOW QUALITY PROTEIN: 2-ketocyclohexanecarboxyl-CoA hydrolase, partial [Streptomyces sp. SPB78]
MADSVLYDVTDALATITLNRPDAMNALDTATKEALRDALQNAAADPGVRAVLLTATGRAFCVGQDLKEHVANLQRDRETGDGGTMSTVREHYNPIVRAITAMPKPVVAGVNGVAAGAGFGFALAADYRVVADTATFNTSFAGVALTADSGLSFTLQRAVGHSRASDWLLFPRNISAREAYELGLVNRLVPGRRTGGHGAGGRAEARPGPDRGVRLAQGLARVRGLAHARRGARQGGRTPDGRGYVRGPRDRGGGVPEEGEAALPGAL